MEMQDCLRTLSPDFKNSVTIYHVKGDPVTKHGEADLYLNLDPNKIHIEYFNFKLIDNIKRCEFKLEKLKQAEKQFTPKYVKTTLKLEALYKLKNPVFDAGAAHGQLISDMLDEFDLSEIPFEYYENNTPHGLEEITKACAYKSEIMNIYSKPKL